MVKVTGRSAVFAYIAKVSEDVPKILRGAAKAGAAVIAEEARLRSVSEDVSRSIVTRTTQQPGLIVAKISVKRGWARSVATWLEYGTAPHFVAVDASQSGGRTARRLNRLNKEGGLAIGGGFVSGAVFHPGAKPHPFLRPALDLKASEAVAAAQSYINSRVTPAGIVGPSGEGDDE